jgi:hypothetical protein
MNMLKLFLAANINMGIRVTLEYPVTCLYKKAREFRQ